MSLPVLPQGLPAGVDPGPSPAAATVAPGGLIRLAARVLAITRRGPLVATGRGQMVLQGAPALRPETSLILELRSAEDPRAGRLLAAGQHRFDPPVPVRLQPAAPEPPAVVRSSHGIEVILRPIGADGRPSAPAFTARLVVPPPAPSQAGAAVPPAPAAGATVASPPPTAGATSASAAPGSPLPVPTPTAPAAGLRARSAAAAPSTGREPAAPTPPRSGGAPAPAIDPLRGAAPSGRPIEVEAVRRDALGRFILRAAGLALHVETAVELPLGARLLLALPAGRPPLGSMFRSTGPDGDGLLGAVRWLVETLPEGSEEQGAAATLRLPGPTAALAARLLRLVQTLGSPPGSSSDPVTAGAGEPEVASGRIGTALAELGRLASESQNGWRLFLLPLGFEGTPALRLYLRDDQPEPEGGSDRGGERSPAAKRAIFELEFSHLGRCQVDALCQEQRFDLIVRTEQTLAPDLQRDLRVLFVAARDAAGLGGELGFRVAQWVSLPDPEITAGAPAGPITV